ncbi:MAG: sugar ABC transporter substrate-binding protein [Tardiphaga sp.]
MVAIATDARGCEIYDEVFAQFEKDHPNIHIEKVYIFSGGYYRKLLTMIAGNVAPDVMWMGEGFNEFAQRGAFLDVTDRIQNIETNEFLEEAMGWYRIKGRQFGIPYGIDMRFIAYNKRLFDVANQEIPKNGWTYSQFLSAAQNLTIRKEGQVVQWGFWGSLDAASFGSEFISADGMHARCDGPNTINYLQTNLDLFNRYKVTPSLREQATAGVQDSISVFQQGRVAMMPMYTWDLPGLRDRCAAMDWDIVENPEVTQRGSWASSQAYVISSQTPHADEAWELVATLTGASFQRQMSYAMLPANLRVARQVIKEGELKPRNLGALLSASNALRPNPRVPHLQELNSLFQDAQQSVWTGRATPEDAMKTAADQINRVVERHRRTAQ